MQESHPLRFLGDTMDRGDKLAYTRPSSLSSQEWLTFTDTDPLIILWLSFRVSDDVCRFLSRLKGRKQRRENIFEKKVDVVNNKGDCKMRPLSLPQLTGQQVNYTSFVSVFLQRKNTDCDFVSFLTHEKMYTEKLYKPKGLEIGHPTNRKDCSDKVTKPSLTKKRRKRDRRRLSYYQLLKDGSQEWTKGGRTETRYSEGLRYSTMGWHTSTQAFEVDHLSQRW